MVEGDVITFSPRDLLLKIQLSNGAETSGLEVGDSDE